MTTLQPDLALRLKARRKELGLTQGEAARQIGVSMPAYVNAELYHKITWRLEPKFLVWLAQTTPTKTKVIQPIQ